MSAQNPLSEALELIADLYHGGIERDEAEDRWHRLTTLPAPVPVERRRCVTHDAESHDAPHLAGECWKYATRDFLRHREPCRFVSVFEVPASPSDATSETCWCGRTPHLADCPDGDLREDGGSLGEDVP